MLGLLINSRYTARVSRPHAICTSTYNYEYLSHKQHCKVIKSALIIMRNAAISFRCSSSISRRIPLKTRLYKSTSTNLYTGVPPPLHTPTTSLLHLTYTLLTYSFTYRLLHTTPSTPSTTDSSRRGRLFTSQTNSNFRFENTLALFVL